MLERIVEKWRKLPGELQVLCFFIILMSVMFGIFSLIKPDFREDMVEDNAEDCEAYSEMVKLNTKAIGSRDCYVEVAPGRWVDKFHYDALMARGQ
jgi:hypothetical protein